MRSSSRRGRDPDGPATSSFDDRGVLVDADPAQALGPRRDPRLNALGGKLREQSEMRNDEVASENAESVAYGHALRKAGHIEIVGCVALLAEHHRARARAGVHGTRSMQPLYLVPEPRPPQTV